MSLWVESLGKQPRLKPVLCISSEERHDNGDNSTTYGSIIVPAIFIAKSLATVFAIKYNL